MLSTRAVRALSHAVLRPEPHSRQRSVLRSRSSSRCTGAVLTGIGPAGTYESQNTPVAMKSLYLAQLCERLGPEAIKKIGY